MVARDGRSVCISAICDDFAGRGVEGKEGAADIGAGVIGAAQPGFGIKRGAGVGVPRAAVRLTGQRCQGAVHPFSFGLRDQPAIAVGDQAAEGAARRAGKGRFKGGKICARVYRDARGHGPGAQVVQLLGQGGIRIGGQQGAGAGRDTLGQGIGGGPVQAVAQVGPCLDGHGLGVGHPRCTAGRIAGDWYLTPD